MPSRILLKLSLAVAVRCRIRSCFLLPGGDVMRSQAATIGRRFEVAYPRLSRKET